MTDLTRTDLITLSRHVLAEQRGHPHATGDLTLLLVSIQLGCKFVSSCVRKAGLVNLTGLAGATNVQGEHQKKLDVLANDIFINSITSSGKVSVMVSEENEDILVVSEKEKDSGQYAVVFDPLDGSSNIDAGVSIGTIFGIYKLKPGSKGSIQDVLRPGTDMVCAGYCLYGSTTILMLSTGKGVNGYTLDSSIGEFILTHPNVRIPPQGKIYSVNEGNKRYWDPTCVGYFDLFQQPSHGYASRYVGSMVADVHRTLLYGGIFGYPKDTKNPQGKLRLLYECFPMAYLLEQAGGLASTGTQRVLALQPTQLHQRCPIFLGSPYEVNLIEKMYKDASSA
ncbi:Fructose-1,6-bisphosphatase [Coelomomyces lativittatus]|nr:Fructose-1,6-bisphosphatase [Coelomomyces lativittatus]KAJ1509931.1 Fructose-1,6-bisphosphatase [Coelomomyces lativittatus]KAJ1511940.1 Fructose-1,6-bisphosphatase [Coelomomyces lativittatus]